MKVKTMEKKIDKVVIAIDRSVAEELVKYVDTYAPLLRACAVATREAFDNEHSAEIGRASCRERV
jgi:hypothetical protein